MSLAQELTSSGVEILTTSDHKVLYSLMKFFLKKRKKLQNIPVLPDDLPKLSDHLAGTNCLGNSWKVVSILTVIIEEEVA